MAVTAAGRSRLLMISPLFSVPKKFQVGSYRHLPALMPMLLDDRCKACRRYRANFRSIRHCLQSKRMTAVYWVQGTDHRFFSHDIIRKISMLLREDHFDIFSIFFSYGLSDGTVTEAWTCNTIKSGIQSNSKNFICFPGNCLCRYALKNFQSLFLQTLSYINRLSAQTKSRGGR